MIPRTAKKAIEEFSKGYPAIVVTGPRQSGKTTLTKHVFKDKPYVSFENPDILEMSQADPRGFLEQYADGAVFDEVQRSPEILSYLQEIIDSNSRTGRFILTGSQQFGLLTGITQSLAGRVAIIHLLPFSYHELYDQKAFVRFSQDLDRVLFTGLYPPIHDRGLTPHIWYANYVQTYIERDVRQLINVRDLSMFQRFVRLCAGRCGQLLNLSSLANDCGITHNTAKAWISILEASYIIFLLAPHYENFNKRIIKTPKIYFYDSGLVCRLLSIQTPEQLNIHALRGEIFESFIVSEFFKSRFNQGLQPEFFFWRDRSGNEIDLLHQQGDKFIPFEIKSGKTMNQSFLKGLKKWSGIAGEASMSPSLIYGGDTSFKQNEFRIFSWMDKKLFQADSKS